MIKKVTDINSLSGVSSPLLPLIYGDFRYPYNDTDGAYVQLDENGNTTALLSLKNGSTTIVKISSLVDINEIETFISFSGVTSVISDFSLKHTDEKAYPLLVCAPDEKETADVTDITVESRLSEYKSVYGLISENGENFNDWFPVFSKKINCGFAVAVYKQINSFPVSTATATAVCNDIAVISGVYTSVRFRNKGYAGECVNTLLNRLYKSGVKKIYLWCDNKNISFYTKLGFTLCGEIYVREDF